MLCARRLPWPSHVHPGERERGGRHTQDRERGDRHRERRQRESERRTDRQRERRQTHTEETNTHRRDTHTERGRQTHRVRDRQRRDRQRERERGDREREETDTEGEETHRETDRQRGSRLPKRERENERKSPLSKHSHRGEDPGGFKTKYAQIDFLCRHNRPGSIDQIPDLLCPSRGDGWAVSDTAFPPFPSAEARRGEARRIASLLPDCSRLAGFLGA